MRQFAPTLSTPHADYYILSSDKSRIYFCTTSKEYPILVDAIQGCNRSFQSRKSSVDNVLNRLQQSVRPFYEWYVLFSREALMSLAAEERPSDQQLLQLLCDECFCNDSKNGEAIESKNDEPVENKNDEVTDNKNDETIESKNDEPVENKNDEPVENKNDEPVENKNSNATESQPIVPSDHNEIRVKKEDTNTTLKQDNVVASDHIEGERDTDRMVWKDITESLIRIGELLKIKCGIEVLFFCEFY